MRISGVYAHMGIRLTEVLFTVITEFRIVKFFICILVFSDCEWTRIVVYMQCFGISLWYCLVWQVDLCLY